MVPDETRATRRLLLELRTANSILYLLQKLQKLYCCSSELKA
jgi:hypothetical protein